MLSQVQRLKLAAVMLACISSGQASEMPMAQGYDMQGSLSCQEVLKPDQLVISGGVSAQSVNPAQAGSQVDQRLANIKTYVAAQRGTLVLLDRLRGARNPDQQSRNEVKTAMPFIQIQRLEVILPVGANVDAVLESLFKLGLDRYGKNVRIDAYSDRDFSGLTTYRFRDLKSVLTTATQRCMNQSVKTICVGACRAKMTYGTVTSRYLTESGQQTHTFSLKDGTMEYQSDRFPESTSAAPITFVIEGQYIVEPQAKRP